MYMRVHTNGMCSPACFSYLSSSSPSSSFGRQGGPQSHPAMAHTHAEVKMSTRDATQLTVPEYDRRGFVYLT